MADALATSTDLALLPNAPTLTEASATAVLGMATSIVQGIVGQRLVLVEDDVVTLEVRDGCDHYLELPERPVVSVSAVEIGAATVADYRLITSRLWRADGWLSSRYLYPYGPTTVDVTYTHGYLEDDQRIMLARSTVLMLAASAAPISPGVTSESIDDYQVVYDKMAAQMQGSESLSKLLIKKYGRGAQTVRVR